MILVSYKKLVLNKQCQFYLAKEQTGKLGYVVKVEIIILCLRLFSQLSLLEKGNSDRDSDICVVQLKALGQNTQNSMEEKIKYFSVT